MQRLLRFMKIEDFNFKVDVFNINQICTNAENPWDGNNAIPNLLFDDVNWFEKKVPYFKVVEQAKSEFFVYLNSGGINNKTFAIPLSYSVLKVLDNIDNFLVSIFPMVLKLD